MANEIEKLNGIAISDIEKFNGKTDSDIEKINGFEFSGESFLTITGSGSDTVVATNFKYRSITSTADFVI